MGGGSNPLPTVVICCINLPILLDIFYLNFLDKSNAAKFLFRCNETKKAVYKITRDIISNFQDHTLCFKMMPMFMQRKCKIKKNNRCQLARFQYLHVAIMYYCFYFS